jgi:hypothetical protein
MKVEYRPWKKLEIRAYQRFQNAEDFANHIAAPVMPMMSGSTNLLWADGVLFRHVPLSSPTEAISTEQLKGNLVWDTLDFALMPKYVPELKPASRPSFSISVLNVSGNRLFVEVAKWAKAQSKKPRE